MKRDRLYTVNKGNRQGLNKNLFAFGDFLNEKIDGKDNPGYMGKWFGADKMSDTAGGLVSGLGTITSGVANKAISGGLSSGAGNAISTIGSGVGNAVKTINPILGTGIELGSNIIGGVTNALWGSKINDAKVADIRNGIADTRNAADDLASSVSTDALVQNWGNVGLGKTFSKSDVGRDGVWGHKAKDLYNELAAQQKAADLHAIHNLGTTAQAIDESMDDLAFVNSAAYGGLFDTGDNDGAINYNFMTDYLINKDKQSAAKNKLGGSVFAGVPGSLFAIGGDMQTNGADFSTGLVHINAGGLHSENPYEGVQVGVDSEGTPNLVEEGEVIFNDYVYSNRILCDADTKKKFHQPIKRDITYAELAKKLEKEASERPNDPISQSALKSQMETLAEQQERQKAEMEAEEARKAFEALSPEEQVAVMQQASEQEQMAEQQVAQEGNQMAEPSNTVVPEGVAPEEAMVQQPQPEMMNVGAEGGQLEQKVRKYAKGSRLAKRTARKYNNQWFVNQARALGMIPSDAKELKDFEFAPNAVFTFSSDDPEANLTNFNDIYRQYQYDKALKNYEAAQRQAKRNQLFDPVRGLYRTSDDGSKVYKAKIANGNEAWVNVNNEFLTQEEYDKLTDTQKEAFRRSNVKAGDRLYGYNGTPIWDDYDGTEDSLLDSYNDEYKNGFKWDDRNAQAIHYPADMEHSAASALRYVPAIGGAIGLGWDLLNSPDYSRAERLIDGSAYNPMTITPHYISGYYKYSPFDVWSQRSRNAANTRGTQRMLMNSGLPMSNKAAGLLASDFNSTNVDGELGIKSQQYNNAERLTGLTQQKDTDKANAAMDFQVQAANQQAYDRAQQQRFRGLVYGTQMMDDIDARRNASINANLTNLLTSIGNIGEEAYDTDRLKWLERTGVLRSNYYDQPGYAKYGGMLTKKTKKGGKK